MRKNLSNIEFVIVIFLFTFILFPSAITYGQEKSLEDLQHEKVEKEIELLNFQINQTKNPTNDFSGTIFQQSIALIGIIGGAAATAFFAWQRERRIPPVAQQEKIIYDTMKVWYSRAYLEVYNHIWKKIEDAPSNEQEGVVNTEWNTLKVKEFPLDDYLKNTNINYPSEENWRKYLKKRLHISDKDEEFLKERIKMVKRSADVEYYDVVLQSLPSLIQSAVDASIFHALQDKETLAEKTLNTIEEDSLKKLKRLMIFSRMREDPEVVKILLKAHLLKKIKDFIELSKAQSED